MKRLSSSLTCLIVGSMPIFLHEFASYENFLCSVFLNYNGLMMWIDR